MIPNITRGSRAVGLMVYLVGDGRHNEHSDQHLVAGDALLEQWGARGQLSDELARRLAHHLDQPQRAFQVAVKGGHVWHASLSLRAEEGIQTDEVWGAIARDFVTAMGFDNNPDAAPCRWVAVRHGLSAGGNNHIHIAVNLVREDGTKASIHHDYSRAQSVARELEQKHGLQLLESRGSDMAMRGEKPAERAQAERQGEPVVASVRLERAVRAAAAASVDEGEFVRRLHQAGVIVRPRFAAGRDDVVAGYSVALRPKPGEGFVWYGGGRLARDLTLPRLRAGWPDTPQAAQGGVDEWRATWRNPMQYRPVSPGREQSQVSAEVWQEYAADVRRLREQLRQVDPHDRGAWAHVARETSGALAAWSTRLEPTPGPLADASRELARTAQQRARDARPRGSVALQSIAGAARVLSFASTGARGTAAEALLFAELVRTAKALHDMHRAVDELHRAERIRDTLGARLDAVRGRLPSPPAEAAATPTAAQRSAAGVLPPQAGSGPLPNPLRPHKPQDATREPRDRGQDR